MFNWFKKKNNIASYNAYKPKERAIYFYWDGKKEVQADPLVLYKKIMDFGPELSVDLKVSTSLSKDASSHHDSLISKIRKIFSLTSLEEGGLTEMETIGLLDHFLAYCDSVKKNSSPSVMSSNPTEDSINSFLESQPTSNSSDSGSVSKESTTEEQEQSPMVQE